MNLRTRCAASMCRAVLRLAFLAVLVLIIQPIGNANAVSDSDWNISFIDDGCVMPSVNSMKWLTEDGNRFIRFTLNDKDKGNCATDRMDRDGAPYWERAELKQSSRFYFNKKYELTFEARFVEGFLGSNETFFQIHASATHCKLVRPPAMLKWAYRRFQIMYLIKKDSNRFNEFGYGKSSILIEDLIGKWTKFKLVFDTSKKPKLSVYLNNEKILDDVGFRIPSCGEPHFKFGIYRAGKYYDPPAVRSVVDFDKFQLKVLDEDFRQK